MATKTKRGKSSDTDRAQLPTEPVEVLDDEAEQDLDDAHAAFESNGDAAPAANKLMINWTNEEWEAYQKTGQRPGAKPPSKRERERHAAKQAVVKPAGSLLCKNCGTTFYTPERIKRCPVCEFVHSATDAHVSSSNGKELLDEFLPSPAAKPKEPADALPTFTDRAVLATVSIDQIDASPDNPRKHFDPVAMQELIDDVKKHGVLQSLILRSVDGGRFVIAGGERRYRAAKAVGLLAVPAITYVMTDEEFSDVQLAENLHRKDLNPIEKAEGLRAAMALYGYSQQEVAERVLNKEAGKGQTEVANHLALLRLPEVIRSLVVDGTLTESHARPLGKFAADKGIMAAIAKTVVQEMQGDGVPNVGEFKRLALIEVHNQSRPLAQIRPTDAERGKLDVRDVENHWGEGSSERVFNVRLWDKIRDREDAERQTQRAASTAADRRANSKKAKAKEESPQEFGRKLHEWKGEWLSGLIGTRLEKAPSDVIARIMLLLWSYGQDPPDFIELVGIKKVTRGYEVQGFEKLCKLKPAALDDLIRAVVRRQFVTEKGHANGNPFYADELLAQTAVALGVNAKAFVPSADFLELYSDGRLSDLATRAGLPMLDVAAIGRKRCIAELIARWPGGFMPRELVTVDRFGKFEAAEAKAAPKKAAKKGRR